MAHLIIDNEEAYRLAQELAEEHGTSITSEVLSALRERKRKTGPDRSNHDDFMEKISELSERSAARFEASDRTRDLFADLYDDDGLPQ